MVHAFIMVKTEPGRSETVRDAAVGVETITEGHVVAGEYDVIAEATGDEVPDVLRTAAARLQGLDGVAETKTYISMSN